MKNFEELVISAPPIVQEMLNDLKTLRERPDYHPEESVYVHIKIVTERLMTTGDMDLVMTGFFHDLFKKKTLVIKNGFPSSPGHENEVEIFINTNEIVKDFIRSNNADPEKVAFMCGQHMRVKRIGEMNKRKRNEIILNNEFFPSLILFTLADRMLMDWNTSIESLKTCDKNLLIGDVTLEWLEKAILDGVKYTELKTEKEEKMSLHKISGKDLLQIGYKQGPVISVTMQIAERNFKHTSKEDMLAILKDVLNSPADYLEDDKFGKVADLLIEKPKIDKGTRYDLIEQKSYAIYGEDNIEQGAKTQMDVAMSLPVTRYGALMPDAHAGYGLPIGGVLATEGAIIPYAVGVDISCSMCLSIFNIPGKDIVKNEHQYKKSLIENTLFGTGQGFDKPSEHAVLDRTEFNELTILKGLKDKASLQLGSSGTGNHFVEFGIVNIDDTLGIPAGEYLALLSHSGSRGLGANVADHYTKIAMEKTVLPSNAKNLAWLDLSSEEGQEYWIAMNLAADYALACHETIHTKIAKSIKATPLVTIKNSHNLAWKEIVDNKELIVHRKGATPAGLGVLGIIPGSMQAPGFLVRGKGNTQSLQSASHGAGRQMSRTVAKNSITNHDMKKLLSDNNITLIGAGLDEAPQAYKDIHNVMSAQVELVDVIGTFNPKIVRMADEEPKKW